MSFLHKKIKVNKAAANLSESNKNFHFFLIRFALADSGFSRKPIHQWHRPVYVFDNNEKILNFFGVTSRILRKNKRQFRFSRF
jgi:hypothetical protein